MPTLFRCAVSAFSLLLALMFAFVFLPASLASAPIYGNDANPAAYATMMLASDGNFYGVAQYGGTDNRGTVFQLTPTGVLTTLHSFTNTGTPHDGEDAECRLLEGGDGFLYGTTIYGGSNGVGNNGGTLYKIKKDGTGFAVLHSFNSYVNGADVSPYDGYNPYAGVVQGADGFLYGEAVNGGLLPGNVAGKGTLYKIRPDGSGFAVVHTFLSDDSEGHNVHFPLAVSGSMLYGANDQGGANNGGTLFQVKMDGTSFAVMHTFKNDGTDGYTPQGVLLGSDGRLYGLTNRYGADAVSGNDYAGTIYVIRTDGTGYATLHKLNPVTDGSSPESILAQDGSGTLFGVTIGGGSFGSGQGTVFRLNMDGSAFQVLHTFADDGSEGDSYAPGVIVGTDGRLYGTRYRGGGYRNIGTVFSVSPGGAFDIAYDFSSFQLIAGSAGTNGFISLLWTNTSGAAFQKTINSGGTVSTSATFGPYSGWTCKGTAAAADNSTRLLWTNADGRAGVWTVGTNGTVNYGTTYGPYAGWTARALAVSNDGATRLLWANTDGRASFWTIGSNSVTYSPTFGPYSGWTANGLAVSSNGDVRLLWNNVNGSASFWNVTVNGGISYSSIYGPYDGWTARGIGVGGDSTTRLLWTNSDGRMGMWKVSANGTVDYGTTYGPFAGWSAQAISTGSDNVSHILWNNSDGHASFWNIPTSGSITYSATFGPY